LKNKQPHSAVIRILIDVHPVLETGELDGKTLSPKELKEFDLKQKHLIQIKGFDLYDCIKNVKDTINKLKS